MTGVFSTPGPGTPTPARRRHPGLTFIYAWPFETEDVAVFLAKKIREIA
jgi:hypothetical protein